MGVVLLSALCFALAGAFYWLSTRNGDRGLARITDETPIAQLKELADAVAKDLGPGSFRQPVKIRGRIFSETPLRSELAQLECLHYKLTVTREYEVLLREEGVRGRARKGLRGREVVSSHERNIPFWLDDGTGRILVHPDQASLSLVQSRSTFRPLDSAQSAPGGTLGYRYEEEILPQNFEVSVFAEATDEGGVLALRKPESPERPFLVSPQTFEELSRRTASGQRAFFIASTVAALLGGAILILGVFR